MDNQILGLVIEFTRQVALENSFGTGSIPLLGVERGAGHVRDHGVAAAEGVLGGTEDVVFRGRLREPDVTAVAAEVARLESLSDVLLDDDGAAGSVDEPRTFFANRVSTPLSPEWIFVGQRV